MQSAPKFIFQLFESWTDLRLHPSLQYKISRVIFHKFTQVYLKLHLLASKFVAGYFLLTFWHFKFFDPLLYKNMLRIWLDSRLHPSLPYKISRVIFEKNCLLIRVRFATA